MFKGKKERQYFGFKGMKKWRKEKELNLPKVQFGEHSYYVVSPSLLLSSDFSGVPIYINAKVSSKPQVIFRKPIPFVGGEHEHAVLFQIEGGISVIFSGIADVRFNDLVKIYGVVRDRRQIIANAIITDRADYIQQY